MKSLSDMSRENLEARYMDALARLHESEIRAENLQKQVDECGKKEIEYFTDYATHLAQIDELKAELEKYKARCTASRKTRIYVGDYGV